MMQITMSTTTQKLGGRYQADFKQFCMIVSSLSTVFLLISVKLGPIFITFLRVILGFDWSAQIAHFAQLSVK
jgi:hypothetical protein